MKRVCAWQKGPLITLFRLVSCTGYARAWWILALTLAVLGRNNIHLLPNQPLILRSLLCALAAYLVGYVIKKKVQRKRPAQVLKDYVSLDKFPLNDSFPSGHAASWTAFAVSLWLAHHPTAPFFTGWAVLVIFPRYYLGVHFPSDLVAGVMLGILSGFFIFPLNTLWL